MALIGAALSALFWLLIGAYNANRIKTWVGAGAGAAREFVVKAIGRAPAPSSTAETLAAANAATRAKPKLNPLEVGANVLGFLWRWRNWIFAGLLFWFAWGFLAPIWSFATCPFGGAGPLWCAQSKADLRERLDEAEARLELEHKITQASFEEGARFRDTANVIDRALEEGSEQIESAASSHETRSLFLAWASADRGLCASAGGCGDRGA